jgi:hypothetical protein
MVSTQRTGCRKVHGEIAGRLLADIHRQQLHSFELLARLLAVNRQAKLLAGLLLLLQ